MTTITADQGDDLPRRRRRLAPAADMLRRAARRADIARKLRRRDVSALLTGIALGVAGLAMPRAIDRHVQHRAQAAVVMPSDLSAQPAVVVTPDPAAPASPAARVLPRASDGLFYATALVNGQPVRFLVDTGASVVTLTAADARKLAIMPAATARGRAETANGRAVFGWTEIDTIDVAGRRIATVRAAVLDKDAGVSLLGQNLLSRLGSLRLEKDKLIR